MDGLNPFYINPKPINSRLTITLGCDAINKIQKKKLILQKKGQIFTVEEN